MSMRAKFYCNSIEEKFSGQDRFWQVSMSPVYHDPDSPGGMSAPENEVFGKYTPSGSISMTIYNKAALKGWKAGQTFYVDFTPAEDAVEVARDAADEIAKRNAELGA